MSEPTANEILDAGEMGCGELVMLIFQKMKTLAPQEVLLVYAYDLAAEVDISAWCRTSGNLLLAARSAGPRKQFWIQKRSTP